jgi:ABC-type multidrug transport system, ATPase component
MTPRSLSLDEPVTGLDPNQIVEIRGLIKKLGKEKLVFMSSHILQEIQATVDRIIIIDKGNIVADGTSEELISDSQGKTQLHLDVINAEENDIQDMKAVIPSVSVKTIKKLEESVNITLEYQNTSDPRKDIFNYAVEKGWILTEMTLTRKNLEDIFRNLTGQGNGGTDE